MRHPASLLVFVGYVIATDPALFLHYGSSFCPLRAHQVGTNEFRCPRSRSTTTRTSRLYNNQNSNARPYFATEKPDASSHIDGVTLGGPISRDRLFFIGAWERQFQRTPQQFFYDVPPPALRAGDFSQAFNGDGSLQVIYNPFTGNPDGTGRQPSRAIRSPRR